MKKIDVWSRIKRKWYLEWLIPLNLLSYFVSGYEWSSRITGAFCNNINKLVFERNTSHLSGEKVLQFLGQHEFTPCNWAKSWNNQHSHIVLSSNLSYNKCIFSSRKPVIWNSGFWKLIQRDKRIMRLSQCIQILRSFTFSIIPLFLSKGFSFLEI